MTPFDRLLAGIETEYGLFVEGRGAGDQVEDAQMLVRAYPGEHFVGWDYRFESPRADLRGFKLEKLSFDPEDAKFDQGRTHGPDQDVRSDRILPTGARFYNDHGHPEYATPECRTLGALALAEEAGDVVVASAARKFEQETGRKVTVYKNNTDYHGASYGTHENYLTVRSLGFEGLYSAVMPMLVARQVLCGAGKVGSETGEWCDFQLSQRADFFAEPFSADTLYRRPVFNTRDEPHADPREWIRLHVICGDANMMPGCTMRKVGLVQIALALAEVGEAPVWRLRDTVRAFQHVSRAFTNGDREFRIELEGGSWTTARQVIESYLAAADKVFGFRPGDEFYALSRQCFELLEDLTECPDRFARHVDWAAKHRFLDAFRSGQGLSWRDPIVQSFDLEYHNIDRDDSLFWGLAAMSEVEANCEARPEAPTRALARGLAASKFKDWLVTATWAALTFEIDDKPVEIHLDPVKIYPEELRDIDDVRRFVAALQEIERS